MGETAKGPKGIVPPAAEYPAGPCEKDPMYPSLCFAVAFFAALYGTEMTGTIFPNS